MAFEIVGEFDRGDGLVQAGVEECDDGNDQRGDGCSPECGLEQCGNGRVDDGEACDDGNDIDNDACTAGCRVARCGDGVQRLDLGAEDVGFEACDDGNQVNVCLLYTSPSPRDS